MEAKAYLERVKVLDVYIAEAQARIDKLKGVATSTTAQMGGERVQASGNQQKMANAVVAYADIEQSELLPLKREKEAIKRTLERVGDSLAIIILYKHYFEGKSLKRIAREERYSYHYVSRVKRRGLARLQRILGE